jgi:hypothetical protein
MTFDYYDGYLIVLMFKCVCNYCCKQHHIFFSLLIVFSADPEIAKKRMGLPVCSMEQEIIEAINYNDVLIICGEVWCPLKHLSFY